MILSIKKFRTYEFIFILFATTFYVIRRLLWYANDFDSDVRIAEWAKVPNAIIWRDLAGYDQYLNTIFPTVTAALLFFVAWYVFHYWVFPKIKDKVFDNQTLLLAILTVLLVLGSCFIFNYFKLFWRFRHNEAGYIIGFKLYPIFRKLHVLTNTFAGIVVIGLYELSAQVYYYTAELYEQKKQTKHQLLSYLILGFSILCVVFWMFVGTIANVVIGGRGIPITLFIILLSIAFHLLFFHKIFPYFAKVGKTSMEKYTYQALGVVGSFVLSLVIWKLANPMELDFPAFNIPTVLGLISATIRWYFFVENQALQTKVFTQSAELSTLRSQINPHFLFNALNTLYAVALKENAEKTANGVQKLGDMMRFMLHENHQDRIPLSKEVEYLQNFIEIQRMRLDETQNIEIRVNLQEPEREIYIAPMLLNPFVENAFKHGISFRSPSWIYITLTLDAQKIYFKVHNSIHPRQENSPEEDNAGVGLENVRKRLELIYPNRHSLEIQESEQDYFVSLMLNYW